MDADKKREATRERVKRYRARKRETTTVTSAIIPIKSVTSPDKPYRMVWIQGRWIRLLI